MQLNANKPIQFPKVQLSVITSNFNGASID